MKICSIFSLRKWIRLFLEQRFLSNRLTDKTYLNLAYYVSFGKRLNLDNPITFNEKLQWLKLYDRNPEYTKLVDKCEVKKYVAETIGEQYVIPTLGVWDKFEQIDFDTLPDQFVLKCTHDSGGLVICRDKKSFDINAAKEKICRSLNRNYFWAGREWPYKDVRPRIIAEKYMEDDLDGKGLTDYKFFCFNGKPRLLYVSKGLEDHATAKISFFDFDGNQLPFFRRDYKPFDGNIALPDDFSKMIFLANRLAQVITSPFIRIDLYSIHGKIYFSEITFYPCSGMIPFNPVEWDNKLGEWISLPNE